MSQLACLGVWGAHQGLGQRPASAALRLVRLFVRLAVFGRRAGIRGTIRRLVGGCRADLQLLEPKLQLLDLVRELLGAAPVMLPPQPGQLHFELIDLQSVYGDADRETALAQLVP